MHEFTVCEFLRPLSEGQAFIYNQEDGEGSEPVIYSYLVERCMLDVMQGVDTVCPVHGSISPQHLLDVAGVSHPYYIAPDVVSNVCVCACVCVCVCACAYLCVCAHVCTYTFMLVCAHVSVGCICIPKCFWISLYVCLLLHTSV